MRKYSLRHTLLQATAVLATLSTGHAFAQSGSSGPSLEEITVTAQRFSENLQRTPVAVTALTAESLEQRQLFNLRDIGPQIPGAVVQTVVGLQNAPRIFIRGVGQDSATFNNDSAVGTYVDGVYIPRLYGGLFDFADIERVEVLRGPQGTLYGRNTSGGAIKLITKRPSDTLTGSLDASYGTFNQFDVKGYLSGPLIADKLAASVSVLSRSRDGISTAVNQGNKKVNNRSLSAERAKFLFTPSDNLEFELALDHTNDDTGPYFPSAIASTSPLLPNAKLNRDILVTEATSADDANSRSNGVTLTGKYKVGELTFTSISAARELGSHITIPLDTIPNSANFSSFVINENSASQELNATYETQQFTAVGGAYYFYEHSRYNTLAGSNPIELSKQNTNSFAAYGQLTWHVTDALSVTGGVRYTNDRKGLYNYYPVPSAAVPIRRPLSGFASWNGTTPKASIEYQVNEDVLAYASYTRGFKAGGWNRVAPSATAYGLFTFAPENVNAFEAGVKLDALDHRLRLNVSGYINNYKGLHVPQQVPGTTVTTTLNASAARVSGIEFEPSWQVTDTLLLYGNAAYTHGKYTQSFLCTIGGVFTECRGKDIRAVVPFKGLLGFTFTPKLDLPGTLRIGASIDYSDKFYNDFQNTDLIASKARALYDALIAYDTEDGHWTVSVEGKNLTDKRYYSTGLTVGTTTVAYPNDPRTVVGRVKYNF